MGESSIFQSLRHEFTLNRGGSSFFLTRVSFNMTRHSTAVARLNKRSKYDKSTIEPQTNDIAHRAVARGKTPRSAPRPFNSIPRRRGRLNQKFLVLFDTCAYDFLVR
jgi:hypothetical protein